MKHSYIIAATLAVGTTVWLATGSFHGAPAADSQPASREESVDVPQQPAHPLTRVQVERFESEPLLREVRISAQSEASRSVTLRAETEGQVAKVVVERGAQVKAGEILLRLSAEDRRERLAQAEALLQQRKLEYQGSKRLQNEGLKAESQLAEALTLLRSAEAQLKQARLNLERATIRAPFAGVLQERPVEEGDYLRSGDTVATLVELDPLRISGELAERDYGRLKLGMAGRATLSSGSELQGEISYLSASADPATRTFTVELRAANPTLEPAGMSAEMVVPLEEVPAQRISQALLALNDAGVVGVKSVDGEGVVHFHPIEILRAEADTFWVGGLPERVRLITAGQGFVRDGDRVEAVEAAQDNAP